MNVKNKNSALRNPLNHLTSTTQKLLVSLPQFTVDTDVRDHIELVKVLSLNRAHMLYTKLKSNMIHPDVPRQRFAHAVKLDVPSCLCIRLPVSPVLKGYEAPQATVKPRYG